MTANLDLPENVFETRQAAKSLLISAVTRTKNT